MRAKQVLLGVTFNTALKSDLYQGRFLTSSPVVVLYSYQKVGTRRWVPEGGYQKVGTRRWVPEGGYQKVGTRRWVPEGGYQKVGTSLIQGFYGRGPC